MNNFLIPRLTRKSINLVVFRSLRGQDRHIKKVESNTEEVPATPAPPHDAPRPQILRTNHPLHRPCRDENLSEPAFIGVSEEHMERMSRNMSPTMKPEGEYFHKPVSSVSNFNIQPISPNPNFKEKFEEENVQITEENQHTIIGETVTPLWKLRYSDQLDQKEMKACKVLNALKKRLMQVAAPSLPAPQPGLACPLQKILVPESLVAYRNSDEFVVRPGIDGNPKTVGFLTGPAMKSSTVCVPPTRLVNIKSSHKFVGEHFQRFIRKSDHATCLHTRDSPGVWKSVKVRSNAQDHLMVTAVIHPHTLSQKQEKQIEQDLINYFFNGPGSVVGIKSLYIQTCPHSRCAPELAPYRLLHGEAFIEEKLGPITVSLAPHTPFEAHTGAADVLYSAVREMGEVSPVTTVLHVNCGAGLLMSHLSAHTRGAVGVDASSVAIQDAHRNTASNSITNTTYIPGPPQLVLPRLAPELSGCSDVLAIVSPDRGGLHPQVVLALRECTSISRILYLSSRPEGYALDNFVAFGNCKHSNHKMRRLSPLLPRHAFTVDTAPQTLQCTMGLLFQRHMF